MNVGLLSGALLVYTLFAFGFGAAFLQRLTAGTLRMLKAATTAGRSYTPDVYAFLMLVNAGYSLCVAVGWPVTLVYLVRNEGRERGTVYPWQTQPPEQSEAELDRESVAHLDGMQEWLDRVSRDYWLVLIAFVLLVCGAYALAVYGVFSLVNVLL